MFHTEALRLEALLADHGVAARVGRAMLSTDSIRFPVQLGLGSTARRVLGLSRTLAEEAGYSRCHLRREGRTLFLELPRDEGVGLRYGDLLEIAGQAPQDGALLGLAEGGEPLALHLSEPQARHLLVAAPSTHEGATLLRMVALGIAANHKARDWRLALLAAHPQSALQPLRALPHCWAASASPEHALGWLARLLAEMVAREAHGGGPRVLALVDDGDALLAVGGPVTQSLLHPLLERGGAVGLHLAFACREQGALGALRSQFPVRLRGVEPGRFVLDGPGEGRAVQVAHLDDEEAREAVRYLRWRQPRVVAQPCPGGAP